jgi:superfamily I DNA/RNA helicase
VALFVAARMTELLDAGRRPSELAALYRTHAHGETLAEELARRQVPLRVRGAREGARGGDPPLDEDPGEAVTLSTVHQAKGLEWNTVFVLSLVENRFPLPAREPADLEEERRLFYVALTRARDELYLCRPARDGDTVLTPSRFLLALEGLVDRWSVLS